ncbi:TcfC E-set like domain-containing protein [Edwardsiella tarda]|uniref:TcfC E-set like domain-containing protein n=2 Tax=Edwardsiella tarda TaxID=636 RepID=UPI00351CB606
MPMTIAATNTATLAMARGMALASGQPLAHSRYGKILTPSAMTLTLVIPQLGEERVEGVLALDSVQVSDQAAVTRFLQLAGLAPAYARQAATRLAQGVNHDSRCKGSRSRCVVNSDGMAVVIDYYARQVRLFFAQAWFARDERQVEYLQGGGGRMALINHASLSANRYTRGGSLYARDYGLLGLPGGYLKYDASSTEARIAVNDFNYVFQQGWFKAQLGAIGNGYDFTPSAQRSLFRNSQMTGAMLGNSAELRVRDRSDRSYGYYLPQPGILEVWRDDKLLLRRSVAAGRGELSYQTLPTGIYPVQVRIKGFNDEIFSSQPLLIANEGPTLEGVSSHITAAHLDRHGYYGNRWMGELGITVPVGPRLSLSALGNHVGGPDGEWLGTLGADWRSGSATLSMLQTLGNHGYLKSDAIATLYSLSLQFTQERYRQRNGRAIDNPVVAVSAEDVLLPETMPDYRRDTPGETLTRRSLLANYSVSLGANHSLQLGYQWFDERPQQRSNNYNVTLFSRLWWDINLTAGVNYTRRDLWSVNLGFSVPFGSLQASSYYLQQNNGRWRSQNTLNYTRNVGDDWSFNAQAGQQFADNGPQSTLSFGGAYQGPIEARSQLYLASDQRNVTGSLDLQSSQVVSAQGISFHSASELNQSALLRLPPQPAGEVQLALKDQASGDTRYYAQGEGRIVALPAYSRYQLESRLVGSDKVFDNHQSQYRMQVDLLPGRMIDAARPVLPVRNQAVLVRRDGKAVDQLRCEGAGCISVRRVQEGLFILQLQPNGAIHLLSGAEQCAEMPSAAAFPAEQLPIVECLREKA